MKNIMIEPKGKAYSDLLDLAFNICDSFILVKRKDLGLNENGIEVFDKLQASLIEMKEQSEWHGTRLLEHTAQVYYYKTDKQAKAVLDEYANSLYIWVQPNLPEDLCFIKNQQPWLVTIAHEKIGYFDELDEEDVCKLEVIDGLEMK